MNNAFFIAGIKTANTAVAAADNVVAASQATKRVVTKGVSTTVRSTKTAVETTKVCGVSFFDGFRHALAMNKALNK